MSISKQTFTLGTAVQITTVLSLDNPSAVVITVKDPYAVEKVTEAAMSANASNVYTYVYQSATTDGSGEYCITIKATYGAYTALSKDYFILEE